MAGGKIIGEVGNSDVKLPLALSIFGLDQRQIAYVGADLGFVVQSRRGAADLLGQ
jgi:hypothetical protein